MKEKTSKLTDRCMSQNFSLERDHTVPPLPSDAVVDAPQPRFIERPDAEKHLVTFYHDETTFQSNQHQKWALGQHDQFFLRKKGRGSGVMISDFIEERDGFLRIPEKSAARKFEFGENRDGFWTSDKFTCVMPWK